MLFLRQLPFRAKCVIFLGVRFCAAVQAVHKMTQTTCEKRIICRTTYTPSECARTSVDFLLLFVCANNEPFRPAKNVFALILNYVCRGAQKGTRGGKCLWQSSGRRILKHSAAAANTRHHHTHRVVCMCVCFLFLPVLCNK